jgi:hypothetical protein
MDPVDSIMSQIQQLTPGEFSRLFARMKQRHESVVEAEDAAVTARGLAALTESTKHEDWSRHYPPELKNRRSSAA